MAMTFSLDTEFLVFTVHQNQYGVPHLNVVAVMDVPDHTSLPCMPPAMRGVIPFQGHSIPLFDLRICFGEQPRLQETEDLVRTMAQRKQDHINWLEQLKREIFANQTITVQTDPHKCAFGKWYDTFHSDNLNLNSYMKRFDEPHQQIHQVAVQASGLLRQGQDDEARHLVRITETGVLLRLIELFDGSAVQIRQYLLEYAIVFGVDGELFAMAVDNINFFSRLHHIDSHLPSGMAGGDQDFVQAVGRYREEGSQQEKDVLLLDVSSIVRQNAEQASNRLGEWGE